MKVAIFFDGKNFYSGFRERSGGRINFPELATWLVSQAGGSILVGCHYYTGIETGASGGGELTKFLEMLAKQRGYFVHQFPRKVESFECNHCRAKNTFTKEKEVDTTIVADILRMAAVDAFDVLVLVSGDADLAPAVEGVRSLGKIAFVATWAGYGLAPRIRNACFDHIDLTKGLSEFREEPLGNVTQPLAEQEAKARPVFIAELRRCQEQLGRHGYVGLNYFLTRWHGEGFTTSEPLRRQVLEALLTDREVEVYDAPDGKKALRLVRT